MQVHLLNNYHIYIHIQYIYIHIYSNIMEYTLPFVSIA